MPQTSILFLEIFVTRVLISWDFFPPFIEACIFYFLWIIFNCMEVKASRTNDSKLVIELVNFNISARFGTSKSKISDGGL